MTMFQSTKAVKGDLIKVLPGPNRILSAHLHLYFYLDIMKTNALFKLRDISKMNNNCYIEPMSKYLFTNCLVLCLY